MGWFWGICTRCTWYKFSKLLENFYQVTQEPIFCSEFAMTLLRFCMVVLFPHFKIIHKPTPVLPPAWGLNVSFAQNLSLCTSLLHYSPIDQLQPTKSAGACRFELADSSWNLWHRAESVLPSALRGRAWSIFYWCCFYYFVTNSLVALLTAVCATGVARTSMVYEKYVNVKYVCPHEFIWI